MIRIFLTDRGGAEHEVVTATDLSLMEAVRGAGIDDLLAACFGCCSCATCHVYLDPRDHQSVATPSEDEDDLLDSSDHRLLNSRLSCQISLTADLDGLRVTIAPED